MNLARRTMCDWMQAMAERLEPRVIRMRERILQSKGIQTDDTPVNVLDSSRDMTKQGRLRVYRCDESQPYAVFDYMPSRAGPKAWLESYRGYLQADAYAGYDELFPTNRELIEIGCWAHARRYFFESKESDPSRALEALARIQQWYAVENEATEHEARLGRRDPEHRRAQQQTRSRPLLESFHALLVTWQREVLPKSRLGQAVHYTLAKWTALTRFLADGDLSIDNNASERDLRAVAIGRKNWLFCGSDRGGETAVILFSILATCRRHSIEPFAYLRELMSGSVPELPDSLAALFPCQSSAATAG